MIDLRGLAVPLAIGAFAGVLFVLAMAIFGGCARAVVLEEPAWVETVAKNARDR